MQLQRGFEDPSAFRGGFVSIGNFDGVHRGHQQIVSVLVGHARKAGVPSVVLTFDPHPIALLRPGQVPHSLSTVEHKAELLGRLGVDCVIAYPTDELLLALSPDEFFDQIVRGKLAARGLVEGPNFFFGHDRSGDIATLERLCEQAGLMLEVVHPIQIGDRVISSSAVRARVAEGNIAAAIDLLGHPYQISGRVARGAARGRQLGFPTANLVDVVTQLPPDGVYAGAVRRGERVYPAAVHLGPNATFGEAARKLEVHILDFDGDLYDELLCVDLYDRIRGTIRFSDANELKSQMTRDVERVREIVGRAKNE
ncbi:MAG: bifunctional riboflavin kinase/FAD synthetase [Planctomycetaceae bacterium]